MLTSDDSKGEIPSPVWSINSDASALDLADAINESLAHLDALTCNIPGEGYESFASLNESIQRNYLWAISRKVGEVKALFAAHGEKLRFNTSSKSVA